MKQLWIIIISFCFLYSSSAYASWTGPREILSLNFGNHETGIGIIPGDTEDQFTTLFAVDRSGNVLLADEYNRKALIFDKTGKYLTTIRPKITLDAESWPNKIWPISNNRVVIASGYYYQIYDYKGNLLNKINIGDNTALRAALWDGNLIISKAGIFYKYSSTGQLVQSYKTKPLELGNLKKSVPVNDKDYRFILDYPDITYSFTIPTRVIDSYHRDPENRLSVSYKTVTRDRVYKITRYGKVLGQVLLPNNEISDYVNVGGEKYANYIARYGNTTFGADGNIYTWKKTDTKYSILKWTWVDDQHLSEKVACPEEKPLEKIILYFQKKDYSGNKTLYTQDDVEVWTKCNGAYSDIDKKRIVTALRNEMYARHGRAFQNPDLKAIFEAVSWYKLKNDFSDSDLNEIERKNVEFILNYEKKMGWR